VLARRADLPAKPAAVNLEGDRVLLRPYGAADAPELHTISDGSAVTRLGRSIPAYDHEELIWRFLPGGPFDDAAGLDEYQQAVANRPDTRTYVVADRVTGELLGSASIMSNDPGALKIEIGSIWYSPAVQGSGVATEVTQLVADHVFGLGYQRFEWKCNSDNIRSRAFAERFGFRFEGIQDAHMIVKGRRRDTAWFRILAAEWPEVRR